MIARLPKGGEEAGLVLTAGSWGGARLALVLPCLKGAERGLGGMDEAATSAGRFRRTIVPNRAEMDHRRR